MKKTITKKQLEQLFSFTNLKCIGKVFAVLVLKQIGIELIKVGFHEWFERFL